MGVCEKNKFTDMPIKVVARWVPIFSKWYICHAKSYQNAFGRKVNGFDTRGEAIEFAGQNGCEIEWHQRDDLQHY
ncbi:MAG: hypothetical protein QM500_17455 [Methylococcales bacterium]